MGRPRIAECLVSAEVHAMLPINDREFATCVFAMCSRRSFLLAPHTPCVAYYTCILDFASLGFERLKVRCHVMNISIMILLFDQRSTRLPMTHVLVDMACFSWMLAHRVLACKNCQSSASGNSLLRFRHGAQRKAQEVHCWPPVGQHSATPAGDRCDSPGRNAQPCRESGSAWCEMPVLVRQHQRLLLRDQRRAAFDRVEQRPRFTTRGQRGR